MEHPFPGVELEGELDRTVIEIDEAMVPGKSDILDIEQRSREAGLPGGIFEIGQRAGIFRALQHPSEMQVMRAAEFLPGLDQPLVDRVVLIGALRDDGALD